MGRQHLGSPPHPFQPPFCWHDFTQGGHSYPLANPPKAIREHALCVNMSMIAKHDFAVSPPAAESLWSSVLHLSGCQKPSVAPQRVQCAREELAWPAVPLLGRKVFPGFRVDFERITKKFTLVRRLAVVSSCGGSVPSLRIIAARPRHTCPPIRFQAIQPHTTPTHHL